MEKIAISWARFIESEPRRFIWIYLNAAFGLFWIIVYLLTALRFTALLGLGLLFLGLSFILFERVGLLLLLDERMKARQKTR